MVTPSPAKLQCEHCGHIGFDVHEWQSYASELNRDTTKYLCDDPVACCNDRWCAKYELPGGLRNE